MDRWSTSQASSACNATMRCGLDAHLSDPLRAAPARTVCNAIPAPANRFAGAVGALDRPCARPGDWVEARVSRDGCQGTASFALSGADHAVGIVFTPPGGGAYRMVVVAADCGAVASQIATCQSGGVTVDCLTSAAPILLQRDGETVRYIPKPWDATELRGTLRTAVEHAHLASENSRLSTELAAANERLRHEVNFHRSHERPALGLAELIRSSQSRAHLEAGRSPLLWDSWAR